MEVLPFVAGLAVLAVALLDALWTTLWPEGHTGPLSGPLAVGVHRTLRALARRRGGRVSHRVLSGAGPLTLVATMLLWVLLTWAGWTLLFGADRDALVVNATGARPDLAGRLFFAGDAMFTLGNGDISPQGGGWQFATALASLSGFVLVTLSVTYLFSVLDAVVRQRSFASQLFALGPDAGTAVAGTWDGARFGAIELQLLSLVEQLNDVTAQNRAYPLLHRYHAAEDRAATPVAVALFEDALTLWSAGVAPELRPAPGVLRAARAAVDGYVDAQRRTRARAADATPPAPTLAPLRACRIPTVDDAALASAVHDRGEIRRFLLGLLRTDARDWPRSGR